MPCLASDDNMQEAARKAGDSQKFMDRSDALFPSNHHVKSTPALNIKNNAPKNCELRYILRVSL